MAQAGSTDMRQFTSYEEDVTGTSRLKMTLSTKLNRTDDAVSVFPGQISHAAGQNVASLTVATAPCIVYAVRVFNSNAAARYFMMFNLAALPADATVPTDVPKQVLSKSSQEWIFPQGKRFSTGFVVCNSTTDVTKTIAGADSFIAVDYELTT